ncbi:protease modulator HflC [Roseococcus sp. SYP-B2431]|uniref:protease modulator HflC n=1 Tax=Roseococcus sp. SYP-B2431 TaxID=2496640 RepID=UPI001040ACFC|nr:protease modulator HflC [Roseococcus sp. SYP-B2431]TCI00090.1 protease modulator HflC [Roseococcus sp. SYP-B2431]
MNRLAIGGAILVALLFTAASSFFTVQQTHQVLITQFGQPIRVIDTPGLHMKVPFIQNVITFDRRLLDFDTAGEEVILGDQRRLIVDSFTRYSITNPLLFFQTVGAAEQGIRGRLNSIVTSSLRRVLASETLAAVLSAERGRIMGEIRNQVNEEGQRFGIEIVDVRIRRVDLPEENTQAILSRMQSERERIAREARAEGFEVAARIRAQAERDRTVLLAEAEANAAILRGTGEQEAIRVFAEAFQRDPEFFQFWRTMQAYREVFSTGESRMVLTPESDFFRYFRDMPARAAAPNPAAAVQAPPARPAADAAGAAPAGGPPSLPSPAASAPAEAPAAPR